jgi:hypothetical protein
VVADYCDACNIASALSITDSGHPAAVSFCSGDTMLGLITQHAARTYLGGVLPSHSKLLRAPQMRSTPRPRLPADWTTRATHYFDATWHTSQTLRQLMQVILSNETLGLKKPPELLALAMESLLGSICPGLPDDSESLHCFHRLLQMHLSTLTSTELQQLTQCLKAQRFDTVVCESVINDVMVAEFGFANGPPQSRQRTLMFTKGFYLALEEAVEAATVSEATLGQDRLLTAAQAQQARDVLAGLATQHARNDITLVDLSVAANQLAMATGTSMKTEVAVAAQPLPPASSVCWEQGQLVVELDTLAALSETKCDTLLASLLRDLLELVLAHKLFVTGTDLAKLSAREHALLLREIEQVLSRPPTMDDAAMPARAAGIIARSTSFGTMQIIPTAGSALGHAWISPLLSVMPDKSRQGIEVGKRLMRSGWRIEPAQCTVNEWDMRWLSAAENESLYPAADAWHLTVPAHWLKLQHAAEDTRQEWQRRKLRYRFVGTRPGMPATGCRVTVWHSVQRAMDEDTRSLFAHFTQGLPEPESPTELALRMRQFMHWLKAISSQTVGQCVDL